MGRSPSKYFTCIRRTNGLLQSRINIFVSFQNSGFDRSFPRDLLRLNVARNSLSEVPSEALLQLKNLNQLDLSFNKIKYIEENTFAGIVFYEMCHIKTNVINKLCCNIYGGKFAKEMVPK